MSAPLTEESTRGALRLHGVLERSWEGVGLSLLWLLGCLPVVTAGSSTLALFQVVAQRRRGDYQSVTRAFWREFKQAPLARAALTMITLLALLGVTQTLVAGITRSDPVTATLLQAAALLGVGAVLGVVVTALPVHAEHRKPFLPTLRLSVAVALGRPLTTLLAVLLTMGMGAATVLFPPLLMIIGWTWASLLSAVSRSTVKRLSGVSR